MIVIVLTVGYLAILEDQLTGIATSHAKLV